MRRCACGIIYSGAGTKCNKCRYLRDRERQAATRRDRWRNDPEYRRGLDDSKLRSRYGISLDQRDELLAAQGGVCAICLTDNPDLSGRKKNWSVDHDHETGVVRGLLCSTCNTGIGHLGDDLEGLRKAVAYLERVEMAAKNQQPCGSRPGPAGVHEHGPVTGVGNGGGATSPSTPMPPKGTPKPTGASKKNPLH